jgi:hypothetical protein
MTPADLNLGLLCLEFSHPRSPRRRKSREVKMLPIGEAPRSSLLHSPKSVLGDEFIPLHRQGKQEVQEQTAESTWRVYNGEAEEIETIGDDEERTSPRRKSRRHLSMVTAARSVPYSAWPSSPPRRGSDFDPG